MKPQLLLEKKSYRNMAVLLMALMSFLLFFRPAFAAHEHEKENQYQSLKMFVEVLEELEKRYVDQVDSRTLIQNAIKGMVENLDPHSSFMPPESFDNLKDDTKGEFSGVGIVITLKEGILTVVSPIEDTPAYKAGIQAGDMIIKIDGKSTKGMPLWKAVSMMRGPRYEPVTLTLFRAHEPAPLTFTLKRDMIPITSVRYAMLLPGYGYLRITNFRQNTAEDVEQCLSWMESDSQEAKGQNLKGLIIDLRDNPGGLLDQAVKISDLFLNQGTIVSIKGRTKKQEKKFTASPGEIAREYPIVVLINGGSASASEIVAGALKDNGRALILGTTSFGKGSVQTVRPLNDGFGLKYTVARYYTPGGYSIQATGIVPDIEVPYTLMAKKEKTSSAFDRMLKEKDLQNSLAPEKPIAQKKKAKPDKSRKTRQAEKNREGMIVDTEGLKRDTQVIRALDALVTYKVFTEIHGS